MSPVAVGLSGIVVVLLLIFLGMPVALSLMLVGFLGFVYLNSLNAALTMVASAPNTYLLNITFMVIPLFVFMGTVVANSAIARRLFDTAYKWLGQWRGGLAMATIAGCGLFAAVCGSSPVTAATMGKVAFPEMDRYKYKPALSAGVIASGGTLGILIPPSIAFVIYSLLTEESVAKLFIAGIIPGVIQAILMIIVIVVWTRLDATAGPASPIKVNFRDRLASLTGTSEVLILFLLVIGGIFLGFFSVNEAAGVGAAGAVLIAVVRRMISRKQFSAAISEALRTTAMLTILIAGGMIFATFISVSRIPFVLADFVVGLNAPPIVILFVMILIYLVTGALMDMNSVLIITIPIFHQLIIAMGFDPIWFGVLVVMMIEIAMITPPIGLNVWIIAGMLPQVPMGQIFKGALIVLIANFASLVVLIAAPQIALFLPSIMK